LMGCRPEDIGFGFNVAQAMNLVVDSLNFQPGDNIVMERWEFPSLLYPMLQQRERGVEVRLLEPENGIWQAPLERVRRAAGGGTILDNALDYLGAVGIERIEPHVLELSGRLRRGLVEAGVEVMTPEPPEQRAGNVAFEVDDERAWRAGLEARGVLTWVSDSRV